MRSNGPPRVKQGPWLAEDFDEDVSVELAARWSSVLSNDVSEAAGPEISPERDRQFLQQVELSHFRYRAFGLERPFNLRDQVVFTRDEHHVWILE